MTDVFISYKNERHAHARRLAAILQAHGYDVWWAARLKVAEDFDEQIKDHLNAAKAVIVLWCSGSCESRYVREEANRSIKIKRLIQCKIEKQCDVPFGMMVDQYQDLSEWNGGVSDPALAKVLDAVETKVGRPRKANVDLMEELHLSLQALPAVLPIPKATDKPCGEDASAATDLDAENFKLLVTADDFEAYVSRYPHGAFVNQAQKRIRELDTAWVAQLPISENDWRLSAPSTIIDKLGNTASRADLEPRARRGCAEAATLLGLQVEAAGDAARGSELYELAAKQGFAPAQKLYADTLAAKGPNNDNECMRWAKASADQDNPWGQNLVGVNLQKGRGATRDAAKAATWYLKAAEQGLSVAQGNLAYLLRRGIGVKRDSAKALEWYRKGAAQGDIESQFGLGMMLDLGEGVASEDANAALVEAVQWFSKAAEAGDARSQTCFASMLKRGAGIARDVRAAYAWYLKAAEQGHPEGQFQVGEMLERGIGVEANREEAVEWHVKAAQQGHAEAEKALARLT